MIMENNSHDKNRTSYTKEITNKRQNLIKITKENRKNNIRSSIYTTENYLQNHIHQQRIVPENHSYSNPTRQRRLNESS